MTETEIVTKVRNIMNEAGNEDSLTLLSEDLVKLDIYITSAIGEAVNLVVKNKNFGFVNRKYSTPTITQDGDSGLVILPNDYIDLIGIKLTDWNRTITKALEKNSEEYKASVNSYTTPGINNPKVFNSVDTSGNKILECYPYKSSVSYFVYESRYDSTSGLNLNNDDPMADAVCYMCASLVYDRFENQTTAKEMRAIAINLISANGL